MVVAVHSHTPACMNPRLSSSNYATEEKQDCHYEAQRNTAKGELAIVGRCRI